jgi:putative methyltransferase
MEGCIRCDPTEDATNGFFVACFVRRDARNEQEAPKRKRVDEEDSHSETDQKESLSTGKKRKKKKKKRKRGTTEGHATYIEQGL